MRFRRCEALLIEPREDVEFDLSLLLQAKTGLVTRRRWVALAPHLGAEVEIELAEVAALGEIASTTWSEREALQERIAAETLESLHAKGLVVAENDDRSAADNAFRRIGWHTHAAVMHAFGRWGDVDAMAQAELAGFPDQRSVMAMLGDPPAAIVERSAPESRAALPVPATDSLDALIGRRVTCRNFDPDATVSISQLATLLRRVFGAQAQVALQSEHVLLKKNVPSAGGLHPIEAYVFAIRVDNLASGIYHYHVGEHALEPIAHVAAPALRHSAASALAGQEYFSRAAVNIVLTARFERTFWKYRNHSKAYRAVVLDAGHVSQMIYLSATDQGLGAFVTSAINERPLEETLGLDPMREGVLAMTGFGPRAATRELLEFDPLGTVWPSPDPS